MLDPNDERTQDYEFTQGDTINLLFDFGDKDNIDINAIAAQGWDGKFTMGDAISGDIITALIKTHDDVFPSGDGVYYNGDTYVIAALGITKNSEVGIIVPAAEGVVLEPGVYPYYFKFEIDETFSSDFTAVKGNIKITKRNT